MASKRKDVIKNILFGFLHFGVATVLGILIPRLFLTTYGSETNGLVSSVKEIFSYFALLEAGVSGATTQALYSPVARKDHKGVSAVLSATNKFYRRTGAIYAFAVIGLAVVYPLLVKTDIPKHIIVGIILFSGGIGVIRYFVTAKLQALLVVDGKNYILTNTGTIANITSDIARILLIYLGANVLLVQAMYFCVSLIQVIIIVVYTRKHYGWLDLKETPDYQAISQRNSVLIHQIAGLIFNNTDTILLTLFCDLKIVSVYAMYTMIYGMISNIISTISSGMSFARGQAFHTDKKQFIKLQETYETYFLAFGFALYTVAYIFIIPFLKLYTKGVTDVNYIDSRLPVLFAVFQILNYGRSTSRDIISYAGHYKQTQWRAILESVINISVSLICVSRFGIYGVLLGTIAALLYRTNDVILYANHKLLNRSALTTYRRWGLNAGLLILCAVLFGRFLPQEYSGYLPLIGCAAVVTIVVLLIFLGINSLVEKEPRRTMAGLVKSILSRGADKF